jgi:DNA-binding PadR family transcriptional regulator
MPKSSQAREDVIKLPIKKNVVNAPDRLGISKVDLLYLIVFHQLTKGKMGSRELIDAIKSEMAVFDQQRTLSHIYDVLKSMESFGWISNLEARERNKIFGLTESGRQKLNWFETTYLETVNKILEMTKHFVHYFQGDPTYPAPELNDEEIKLLNRMISVKHTVRYLFLDMLEHQQNVTGKQFLESMEQVHQWKMNDAYLYQLLRAIEGPEGWIVGSWDDPRRRNTFYYQLTTEGKRIMPIEGANTVSLMKDVMRYTSNILRLFGKLPGS